MKVCVWIACNESYSKVEVHYSDICKSELRTLDRRAAMCVENIFYKTKKSQVKVVLGKSQILLRFLNAGNLKQQETLGRLICHF